MDELTEVRFWAQVLTDAERTIFCSPDNESRIKSWIAARGLAGQLTVEASPVVPDDQLIVLDQHAVEAGHRKATQEGADGMKPEAFDQHQRWLARERIAAQINDPRWRFPLTGI
jgi:DMSO/TMAO reductase YedYZ molybdopterin-dependent catalytic subunit